MKAKDLLDEKSTEEFKIKENAMNILLDKELYLRELKVKLVKQKITELNVIKTKFDFRINKIDKDIQNIQIAAQTMINKKEYGKLKRKKVEETGSKHAGRPKKNAQMSGNVSEPKSVPKPEPRPEPKVVPRPEQRPTLEQKPVQQPINGKV